MSPAEIRQIKNQIKRNEYLAKSAEYRARIRGGPAGPIGRPRTKTPEQIRQGRNERARERYRILREGRQRIRRAPITATQLNEALLRQFSGESIRQIAACMNLHHSALAKQIKAHSGEGSQL